MHFLWLLYLYVKNDKVMEFCHAPGGFYIYIYVNNTILSISMRAIVLRINFFPPQLDARILLNGCFHIFFIIYLGLVCDRMSKIFREILRKIQPYSNRVKTNSCISFSSCSFAFYICIKGKIIEAKCAGRNSKWFDCLLVKVHNYT